MYCPKCGAELREGSVICTSCGEHFALEAQRGKVIMTRARSKSIISDIFKSKLFLVHSIFLSILCGASLFSIFYKDAYGETTIDVFAALLFAFSLVAMIAAWRLYAQKEDVSSEKIKQMRMFPKLLKILCNIFYIMFIVVAVLLIIFAVFSASLWSALEEAMDADIMQEVVDVLLEEGVITAQEATEILKVDLLAILPVILAGTILAMLILIAIFVVYSIAFKKTERHFTEIMDASAQGQYTASSTPSKFIFVMGIICASFGGIIALGSVSSIGQNPLTYTISNLTLGALGAYMITLSLIFKNIHAEETENNKAIAFEQEQLSRVAQLTNQAVAAWEAEQAAQQSAPENEALSEIPTQEE